MRPIDADALLKEFESRQEHQISNYCDCFLNDAQELSTEWYCVEDMVEAAPTIDAVPVVRCKDCKHKGHCEIEELIIHGINGNNPFCSYGERKEENA